MDRFLKSFSYAFHGLKIDYSEHRNMIVQSIAGILVVILALFLRLDVVRVSVLLIVISQVLALEMVNTALEKYIDKVTPEEDKGVGYIKDFLAGAVLLSAIIAAIIGIIIFYNPIFG
jgi:diacylglycerol kinase